MERPELPIGLPDDIEDKKATARAWFESLRDTICASFEALEDELTGPLSDREPGRFVAKDWQREDGDGGGGRMSMMEGRVFEKVGVHTSTVHGEFSPEFRAPDARRRGGSALLGLRHLADRPSGQSQCAGRAHEHPHGRHHQPLVRRRRRPDAGARPPPHPGRPRHPAVPPRHGDRLPPPRRRSPTTDATRHGATNISILKHRNEPRGIGGIFFDWLHSRDEAGGWDADFAFAQDVGRAFDWSIRKSCAPISTRLDRSRPRGTTGSPRPLCRVQPALRPRHDFRPEDRRQCRSRSSPRCRPWCAGRELLAKISP